MEIKTHKDIDQKLSGKPVEVYEGKAKVELRTEDFMKADEKGLIHGGFLFSAADYAAMLAVNEPNVVLAKAQVLFLKPAVVGDKLTFEARVESSEGKKRLVKVESFRGGEKVFEADMLCVVPSKHVLD